MAKPYFSYGTNLAASNRDLVTSTIRYENQTKRFFSSLDAEIYMGGERILDINRIDFSYQENKMPIYGFNSFVPSKVIVGQKIIQGTFVINFTKPGYIAELLNSSMKESSVSDKYDKVGISCDTNNSALFKKPFDILIGYGGHNTDNEVSYKSCYQILQGVYITGFQQILDTSGEPVYEVYTFLAKNFSFDGVDTIYKSGTTTNATPETNTGNKQANTVSEPDNKQETNKEEIKDQNTTESQVFNAKLLYDKLSPASSKIYINFPKEIKDSINSVRVIIADNTISMSRSYTLKNTGLE